MRALGVRDLVATCQACGYHTTVNVDFCPDQASVMQVGAQLRCRRCGHQGVNVRPDWP
jgi:ribosomal protein L37E